jgi:16S rRNA (adenine1518-N6/adenine1519-N6)-dimethyltransferase
MVQLEVAERINAKRGTKEYGILAVLFQTFCKTELLFKVSPNVFHPIPKVWSAVIRLEFLHQNKPLDFELFVKVVRSSFGHRRKTLKNSLKNSIFKALNFENLSIDLSRRAEDLTLDEFKLLSYEIAIQFKPSTGAIENK